MNNQFALDVHEGLSAYPKFLSSKYFYDETGDRLFQKIMNLDEYYLTNAEYEIFEKHKDTMLDTFQKDVETFNLVEFGAGDGYKTKVLIRYFLEQHVDFTYIPIDISGNVLDVLEKSLKSEFPNLKVRPLESEYFAALSKLENGGTRNVVLFLGSNIGNFPRTNAVRFLQELGEGLHPKDQLMIGFDLKKDPLTILRAYDDSEGVTKSFNFNLLTRINNELGGDFDLSKFIHFPSYNPETGTTQSFLISTEEQVVTINENTYFFHPWESIHTEISQKFSIRDINALASECGFEIKLHCFDSRQFFVDSLWMR